MVTLNNLLDRPSTPLSIVETVINDMLVMRWEIETLHHAKDLGYVALLWPTPREKYLDIALQLYWAIADSAELRRDYLLAAIIAEDIGYHTRVAGLFQKYSVAPKHALSPELKQEDVTSFLTEIRRARDRYGESHSIRRLVANNPGLLTSHQKDIIFGSLTHDGMVDTQRFADARDRYKAIMDGLKPYRSSPDQMVIGRNGTF